MREVTKCHVRLKYYTVNSDPFARVLFSRNFADAKFREKITLAKWRNHSSFTYMYVPKSCPSRNFYVTNMPFNVIRENKILARMFEFTVMTWVTHFGTYHMHVNSL